VIEYSLYRVHPDGTEEFVSEHPTFEDGWMAGTSIVTVEDRDSAYSLYLSVEGQAGSYRVAKFGHSRLMIRTTSIPELLLA
jgi:hypothetical protein